MSPRAFLLATLLVAGCKYMPALTPYKMDVQQGNVVTQEMMARLQPGMTRSQVRFALGTPLVVDPFRGDRWDYVYLYQKQGVVTEQRRIVVVFKDDKLARIEGDVVPAGTGGAKTDKPAPLAGGAQLEQK
jgi:outer membrane protein assembly factor BamE